MSRHPFPAICAGAKTVFIGVFTGVFVGCSAAPEVFEFHGVTDHPTGHGPSITLMFVAPVQTNVGLSVNLVAEANGSPGGKVLRFEWSALGGTIANPLSSETTYVCQKKGPHRMTLTVTDSHARSDTLSTTIDCM